MKKSLLLCEKLQWKQPILCWATSARSSLCLQPFFFLLCSSSPREPKWLRPISSDRRCLSSRQRGRCTWSPPLIEMYEIDLTCVFREGQDALCLVSVYERVCADGRLLSASRELIASNNKVKIKERPPSSTKKHKKKDPAAVGLGAQRKSAYSGLAAVDSWSVTSTLLQRGGLHPGTQSYVLTQEFLGLSASFLHAEHCLHILTLT